MMMIDDTTYFVYKSPVTRAYSFTNKNRETKAPVGTKAPTTAPTTYTIGCGPYSGNWCELRRLSTELAKNNKCVGSPSILMVSPDADVAVVDVLS